MLTPILIQCRKLFMTSVVISRKKGRATYFCTAFDQDFLVIKHLYSSFSVITIIPPRIKVSPKAIFKIADLQCNSYNTTHSYMVCIDLSDLQRHT